jgi:RNA polymerase-binding transcription factor DksA
MRLHEELRVAATSRRDYEPHDVTDDEAAIQADSIEGRLAAMDEALERIDSGGYGTCLVCGSRIADERFEALPATAFCRRCVS